MRTNDACLALDWRDAMAHIEGKVAFLETSTRPLLPIGYVSRARNQLDSRRTFSNILHDKKFNVRLMCIPAETSARANCKGTKSHVGYSAREECVVYGKRT